MKLPSLLLEEDNAPARDVLSYYYGLSGHRHGAFTGAWFDTWDTTGSRSVDSDRFTADDLVAVSCLSVHVPPEAARVLLSDGADRFSALLSQLGPDRDLVEERHPWPEDWAGWVLWSELAALPGMGPTTVSKVFARKRPRLRPICDSVVARVIDSTQLWEPLRAQLQAIPDLHPRLLGLRDELKLPVDVSALRVFDVLTWMEGKGYSSCPWSSAQQGRH